MFLHINQSQYNVQYGQLLTANHSTETPKVGVVNTSLMLEGKWAWPNGRSRGFSEVCCTTLLSEEKRVLFPIYPMVPQVASHSQIDDILEK